MRRHGRFPALHLLLSLLVVATACSSPPSSTDATDDPETDAPRLDDATLAARRGLPHPVDVAPTRIAFGSCNRTDLPQPLWTPIVASDPDIWIWLGDNVYGDTDDMSVMRAKYERQLTLPGYPELLGTAEITGTWDDHDYGSNNAGSDYPMREASQVELLDFLGVPADSERRDRAGVYGVHTWGPEGQRVKLLLLDSRYHRDEPGADGGILGEEQWAWLESELRSSDAQLHLIANGIQVLHEDHRYEKWAEFPAERQRLMDLIAATGAPGVILLSGDRHISELARLPAGTVDYPLWEVTSSGMTHSWDDNPGEENRWRVGELYTELGFGMIEIDWDAGTLALQLRNRENEVAEEQVISLAELRPTE